MSDSHDEPPMVRGLREAAHLSVDPSRRFGRPCLRGTRITPADVLGWLASGMSFEEITDDFPEIDRDAILASLRFAADATRRQVDLIAEASWWTEKGTETDAQWQALAGQARQEQEPPAPEEAAEVVKIAS